MLDDRNIGAGGKFKDADLIGIPLRVAIGARSLDEGVLELKVRGQDEVQKIPVAEIEEKLADLIAAGLK